MNTIEFGDARLARSTWSRLVRTESGCWIWTGQPNSSGYGPHRKIWSALCGPVPAGMDLAHGCHIPLCCRPHEGHARPRTHRENLLESPIHWSAQQARQTTCSKGHELTEDNLVPSQLKRGQRACKICHDALVAERRRLVKTGASVQCKDCDRPIYFDLFAAGPDLDARIARHRKHGCRARTVSVIR